VDVAAFEVNLNIMLYDVSAHVRTMVTRKEHHWKMKKSFLFIPDKKKKKK